MLEPEALAPADGPDQFTAARPFRVDTAAGSFEALEVNTIASDLLTRAGPDALRAQQLLASLAVIALEQPNRTRGVVINTPLLWNVTPARANAVTVGLRDHPLLQGATLSDLFRIQPVGQDVVRNQRVCRFARHQELRDAFGERLPRRSRRQHGTACPAIQAARNF